MGSGKSSAGRRLARLLGWRFRDMDREIERAEGRRIAEIFESAGEPYFRRVEARTANRLLEEERVVIASGGGWPCAPGRLEKLGPDTLSIWLKVPPEVAVARALASRTVRPLLRVADPMARAEALLREREPFYRLARWTIETDRRTPKAVAREIRSRMEREG